MTEKSKKSPLLNNKTIKFLKELGWLLEDYKDIDFKNLYSSKIEYKEMNEFRNLVPKNQNKSFLIGCLPSLFLSKDFFPTNEEIINFVNINIPSLKLKAADKRSRPDMIGRIVCSISELDDNELGSFTNSLKKIIVRIDNNEVISNKDFFSEWNSVIQKSLRS
ncbi:MULTISPECIES: hypothetical protein [Bacillus amyloliquefaciens group]|uniref:hypothetical protein n=1 Tax=Bacillus amyloliquefaciens group TaxID=1938374 RepID=UPI0005A343CE|nr:MULTISPECIES: hypothetical protein [Bacillus amyloliquefaciens group]AJH25970.1 hypothetical protein SB45_18360 [Bacillus velezensis]AKD24080.1 hypothetical protein XM40_18385 [Bacillus velezensis]UTY66324.1 hypothetical protein NN913_19180 [Bacillus velezensis]UUA77006.1 hypothetical protein NO220_18880 [Bacillus amyloliquefaciens]